MHHALQPVSRHFTSQSLNLHYLDWGNEGAPTLILQHGGFDHAHSMDWIARELAADWHVVAPDLRGHGDSAWSPDADYTMPALLLDFANLVEVLGGGPLAICAHSLGAIVTTRFAGIYPEKISHFANIEGLRAVGGRTEKRHTQPVGQRIRDWVDMHRDAQTRSPRRYPDEASAFSRMREKNPYLTDDQVAYLTHHALRANGDGSLSWKFDPRLNIWPLLDFPRREVEQMWQAITCPILFFHGSDTFMPNPAKDGSLSHFAHGRLIEYDRASHWLHHDRLDDFVADLRAFLTQG